MHPNFREPAERADRQQGIIDAFASGSIKESEARRELQHLGVSSHDIEIIIAAYACKSCGVT